MPQAYGDGWTSERVGTLFRRWAVDGWSASQIGRELGVTRSAVLGKTHRLGFKKHGNRGADVLLERRVRQRAKVCRVIKRTPPRIEIVVDDAELAPIDPTLGVLRLNAFTCRYPIGHPDDAAFAFCGRTCDGPYCGNHMRLCYQPATERQRKHKKTAHLARYLDRSGTLVSGAAR